eukprot:2739493-Prymnesium_polylepis.1
MASSKEPASSLPPLRTMVETGRLCPYCDESTLPSSPSTVSTPPRPHSPPACARRRRARLGGARWREMARDGARWREMARDGGL